MMSYNVGRNPLPNKSSLPVSFYVNLRSDDLVARACESTVKASRFPTIQSYVAKKSSYLTFYTKTSVSQTSTLRVALPRYTSILLQRYATITTTTVSRERGSSNELTRYHQKQRELNQYHLSSQKHYSKTLRSTTTATDFLMLATSF